MKRIAFAIGVAAISVAHAQSVTCNTYGTMATCNGSTVERASAAYVQPNILGTMAQGAEPQAQLQHQAMEAEVLREQAALIATQREALEQQQAAARAAARQQQEAAQRAAADAAPERRQEADRRAAAAAGISADRYDAARARCRANAGDESLRGQLSAADVLASEARRSDAEKADVYYQCVNRSKFNDGANAKCQQESEAAQ